MSDDEKKKLLAERNDLMHRIVEINARLYDVENDWFLWAVNNDPRIRFAYNQGRYDERHGERAREAAR